MADADMLAKVAKGDGFIAALDQSGGSTPGALRLYGIPDNAYSGDAEMFSLMHQMRVRIMTAPAFTGAKVVATGSALTHFTFVAHVGLLPIEDKRFALAFMVPSNARGVKFISRVSNEQRAAVLGRCHEVGLGRDSVVGETGVLQITGSVEQRAEDPGHMLRGEPAPHVIQQVAAATPNPALGAAVLPRAAEGSAKRLAPQGLRGRDDIAAKL